MICTKRSNYLNTFHAFSVIPFPEVLRRRCAPSSVSAAAIELNQSKGSVSYQISKLESELGFRLFDRAHARLALTPGGQRLWHVSQAALSQIDREIAQLRGSESETVKVEMLTYFSSRWLSPRLMRFFETYPRVSSRQWPASPITISWWT